MKYLSCLVIALSLSFVANAGPDIERIKQQDPEAYEQAHEDCKTWAEGDSIAPAELPEYMKTCIDEAVGYLDDDTEGQEFSYEEVDQ